MSIRIKKILESIFIKAAAPLERAMFPTYYSENFCIRDCVAIFPKKRIIVNRIKKAGNTSITAFFADIEGIEFDNLHGLKSAIRRPLFIGPKKARALRNYYSIVFVRNPYERVLSAFRDKVGGANPMFSKFPGYGIDSPSAFHQFVSALANGELYSDRHWYPQVDLLYKPISEFSFIGKLESIEHDMSRILNDLGLDAAYAQKLKGLHNVSTHSTGSSALIGQYFSANSAEKIYWLYRKDFEAFNFSREHPSFRFS
jgi:hypothetical protein